jgi:hypothetical protein
MAKDMETATKADQELDAIKEHVEALRTELAMLTKHIKGLSSATLERAQTAGALKIEELGADFERAADALRGQGQVRRRSRRSRTPSGKGRCSACSPRSARAS